MRSFLRLSELQEISVRSKSPDAYFQENDSKLTHPFKRPYFCEIERDLQKLDVEAWESLKSQASERLIRTRDRGWQPLFDTLNEAKAYNYLVAIGCTEVRFVPRSKSRTPDLRAMSGHVVTLCEVKTINLSKAEMERLRTGGVGTTELRVDGGLLRKIASDLANAADQMVKFAAEARRIVYVIVNFDNNADMALEYQAQVREFVALNTPADVEVVLFFKEPFTR